MTRRKTQKARVLDVLRDRGQHGVTGLEWCASPPDGGPPIVDCASICRFLRQDGHGIESRPFRSPSGARYARYVLVRDAAAPVDRRAAA